MFTNKSGRKIQVLHIILYNHRIITTFYLSLKSQHERVSTYLAILSKACVAIRIMQILQWLYNYTQ